MIILGGIIAAISLFQSHLEEQRAYEDYSDSYESSYAEASVCEPGLETTEDGVTESLCVWDNAGSIRLDSIARNEQSTTVKLTHIAEGGGYCIWDMNDDRSFKLKDLNTGKVYPLVMQETTIDACEEFTYGDYGEEFPVMLVYDALPATTTRIEIYENLPNDEQFSPTRFDPIEIAPRQSDLTSNK